MSKAEVVTNKVQNTENAANGRHLKPGEIPCVLKGTDVCPRPGECSGYAPRLCDRWEHNSGR